MKAKKIKEIYDKLLDKYGYQGWWPLLDLHNNKSGINPTKTGSINGYHPGNYDFPTNDKQKFEICLGAILTQNTSWPNVEKALINLQKFGEISAQNLLNIDDDKLKEAIRPAGYYNQKAKKIRIFAQFYLGLSGKIPSREKVLELWGIGNETADSILLYAYKQNEFVVDTYTKRLLIKEKLIDESWDYSKIKKLFEENLEKDFKLFQEFHALIVENGKQ